jgi:hypothetical protein
MARELLGILEAFRTHASENASTSRESNKVQGSADRHNRSRDNSRENRLA